MKESCNDKQECLGCGCVNRNHKNHAYEFRKKIAEIRINNEKYDYKNHIMHIKKFSSKDRNYISQYHKGLLHNDTGDLVYPEDYEKLVKYVECNDQYNIKLLHMGTPCSKFHDPFGSLSVTYMGMDVQHYNIIQPPDIGSIEIASEMLELYYMADAREQQLQFITWSSIFPIEEMTEILPTLIDPPVATKCACEFTNHTIFRGATTYEHIGPYISQFLFLNIPMSNIFIPQIYVLSVSSDEMDIGQGRHWGTDLTTAVQMQNNDICDFKSEPTTTLNYITTGRDLATFVEDDPTTQVYVNTCNMLFELKACFKDEFPTSNIYDFMNTYCSKTSIICAINEVCRLALNIATYWKWQVYMRIRPEAYSILVNEDFKAGTNNYTHPLLFQDAELINEIADINNNENGFPNLINPANGFIMLPQVYRRGSPNSPSYPSSHAVVAGACVTVIKYFFKNEQWINIINRNRDSSMIPYDKITQFYDESTPIILQSNFENLTLYPGMAFPELEQDFPCMSIYSELHKLASNISFGRMWAGVNYRTDCTQGMYLGEQVAINYLEDMMSTWVQNSNVDANNKTGDVPIIPLEKFNGETIYIKPKICLQK
jgi:hypothetical protein